MRILVKSLKRLYVKGRLTQSDIQERLDNGLITEDEYLWIIGGDLL